MDNPTGQRAEPGPGQLFIAWMPFQRRQVSMAPPLGFDPVFLPISQGIRALRPWQYLTNAWKTLALLRRRRPGVIWVQLPQVPLLTTALWYRRFHDPGVRIVADCHNRILNPPWNRWPGLKAQNHNSGPGRRWRPVMQRLQLPLPLSQARSQMLRGGACHA